MLPLRRTEKTAAPCGMIESGKWNLWNMHSIPDYNPKSNLFPVNSCSALDRYCSQLYKGPMPLVLHVLLEGEPATKRLKQVTGKEIGSKSMNKHDALA